MEKEKEVKESLKLKFTSGNKVPVTRAIILRPEYEVIEKIFERFN